MAVFSSKDLQDQDLEFMSEVEAAMRYRGSSWAYIFSAVLLGLFALFLLWATFTDRNEVTQGTGNIIPYLGVQPVQSEEGGIIKGIMVREGESVHKDRVLAIIANEKAVNDYQELLNRSIEFELGVLRLKAEQANSVPMFSAEQWQKHSKTVNDQMELFTTRQAKFDSEGKEQQATLEQRKAELAQAQLRLTLNEKILALMLEKKRNVEPLVPKSFSEIDFNNLKYAIASKENELRKSATDTSRLASAVHEAEERLKNRNAERQAAIAKELNDYRQELNSIQERMKAGGDIVQRAELRSVVTGTVKRILVKEDAVVRPAELIMEILPTGDDLEVLAKFKPSVRAYLAVQQNATVKVTAYDSTVYGALNATITFISPDTIEDNKGEPWYEVRLRTTSNKLIYKPHSWFGGGTTEELEIKTGMTVDVDVHSGSKSILAYLVKPLFKSQQQGKAIGKTEAQPVTAPAPTNK